MDGKPDTAPALPRSTEAPHVAAQHGLPLVSSELRASLEARRELGPEYEGALVEGFLDRLDQAIDARVDARLEQRSSARPPGKGGMDGAQLALGIGTTALGIPLTAIVTTTPHGSAILVLVIWLAIVLVNVAAAASRRR